MKISCPSCSAKYSIADEKVQNRLAKIRCRKCGTSIVIDGNVSPANVYAAEGEGTAPAAHSQAMSAPAGTAGAATAVIYTVDFGENDQRQMSLADVVASYNAGSINAETYLWADGFADWTPLSQISEVVAALQAAAGGIDETSAAGASTALAENPWADSAASTAAPTPAPAAAAAATGADLFGGIDHVGGESEVATSGSSTVGTPSPFGGGAAASTGARNESSVLFSLSALTSAAGNSKPSLAPSAPISEGNDDSGLIDLKALTATAEARPMAPAMPAAPAPLGFGGGLTAPLGTPGGASPYGLNPSLPPQQAKNSTGLFIAGGIVVAAVVVALIVVLGGKEEPPPPPPPAPAALAAPAPLPPPMPTATALPTAEAKAPATGTAEEEPAPGTTAPTPKKTTTYKKPTSSSPSPSPSPSPKPSPAPAPKKAAGGGCGCKADDLMCAMRCSAK